MIKKIIIIFVSVVLLVVTVLLVAPFLFKDKLMEIAKIELNKMLLAKVDFKDLKLSFIRNFPKAYIALEGLEVTGVNDFEGELLGAFDRLSVTVDILSVIKMDNIEVNSILLDRARLNGHILEDGRANWEIFKPSEKKEGDVLDTHPKEETSAKEETSPFVFKVGLKRFEIREMEVAFTDDLHNMKANIQSLNLLLRGDMAKAIVDLDLNLGIDGIDFWLNGIRFTNKANVGFVSKVGADLENLFFTIKDNRFNLNDIVLKLEGSAGIKNNIDLDIAFATEKTDFKSLLSLIPVIYMNDFKDLKTTGSLALNGYVKGTYSETSMPNASVNLTVENAMFSYPDLPKSVERVNIALKAYYDGAVFDRSTVDLERLSFEMAGNPFNAELHVKTPESDMQVSAKFAGKIDFDSIADIVPLDDIKLNGLLECDIALAGRLSMLEQERYEDFQAEGNLIISGFNFESPAFPMAVNITSTHLNFTPRRVELLNFDAVIGNSDVAMHGSLENFIPFVFKNETIKGMLALYSNTIDLNELMSGEASEKPAEKETETANSAQLNVIEVPKNIDFALAVNIGNIYFDKLAITETIGAVLVRDGRLIMQNLQMNLLDGSMALNGEYNTQNTAAPFIDFDMNIKQFEINSAISSFSMIENILPEPQNYFGKVSASLNLHSILDEHLSPVLDSVNSRGSLQTHNLELRNSKLFVTMADFLKNENWRTPHLGDINIGYEIKNGRLYINDPIVMNMPSAKVELRGDIGLDATLNYRVDTTVPISIIGKDAVNILNNIPFGSIINEIKVTGLVGGTAKNPEIHFSAADMANTIAGAVREQITEAVEAAKEQFIETVTQKVEEVTAQVNEEINRQIEAIMAEARRQADNIRNTAKQAADRVRREANAAADKLISDAADKNIIERRLAQTAADLLRSEGESNARKLEQEAETQAQAALAEAQRRADELRRN